MRVESSRISNTEPPVCLAMTRAVAATPMLRYRDQSVKISEEANVDADHLAASHHRGPGLNEEWDERRTSRPFLLNI